MHCGERMPRSCECFRQCRKFYCKGGKGACEMPRDPWFVRCFERLKPAGNNSTAAAIYSDVPEEWEEKQGLVAWHRGIRTDLGRERLTRQKATTVSEQLAVSDPCWMAVLLLANQELHSLAFDLALNLCAMLAKSTLRQMCPAFESCACRSLFCLAGPSPGAWWECHGCSACV